MLLDPGAENLAIHGAVHHQWGDDGIAAQPGNEGGRLPVTVRDVSNEPLALAAAPAQPCHGGIGASLVDEDQSGRVKQSLCGFPQ